MDLSTRERWEGVMLTEAEAFDVLDRISDAWDDAARHVAGRILWKKHKPDDESGDGGDEQ